MIYIALSILLPVLAAAFPNPSIYTPITTLTTGDAGACQNFAGACVVYATTVAAIAPPTQVSGANPVTTTLSSASISCTTTEARTGNADGFIDATASAGADGFIDARRIRGGGGGGGYHAGAVQLKSPAHWLASLFVVSFFAGVVAALL